MKKSSLISLLHELSNYISSRRKYQGLILLILTLLGSLAEIISLGSVVPFIGVLVQPETIFEYPYIQGFKDFLQITKPSELILPLTILFGFAAILAGSIRLLLLWVGIRLSNATGADLGMEVYKRTLYQPYPVHVSRSSSEIISGIIQKVGATTAVLLSLITVITSGTLLLAILTTLIFIDPIIASITLSTFGIVYFIIALFTKNRLSINSTDIASAQTNVIKSLQEGLGAIRDVLLGGTQDIYAGNYRLEINKLRFAHGGNSFINQAPRFGMEALGMILIALLAYSLSYREGGMNSALPLLGALALGAQRLLPLLQMLYGNWSVVVGSRASLIDVLTLLRQDLPKHASQPEPESYKFKDSFGFNNISFQYSDNQPLVLHDVSFTIKKGQKIGICGTTGSGKSTMMDIIMMLLEPSKGQILVDGKVLNDDSLRPWQLSIAHVPQNIFLSDSTIAENIAFGIPYKDLDMDKVKLAAEKAQIIDYIDNSSAGMQTIIGEQGIRLSGGQRQRIALARALYRDTSILVFDEATSALDSKTELAVMNSINSLDSNLTILIIAHRISTLRNTDHIIRLEDGQISFQGTYNELKDQSDLIDLN